MVESSNAAKLGHSGRSLLVAYIAAAIALVAAGDHPQKGMHVYTLFAVLGLLACVSFIAGADALTWPRLVLFGLASGAPVLFSIALLYVSVVGPSSVPAPNKNPTNQGATRLTTR